MGQLANIGVLHITLKGKGKTVQAASINWDALINAPQKREVAPMVSVRIPTPLIEATKAEAARREVSYSVLFRQALVKLLQDAGAE
jgi:predicted DNA binding CopG/RHH family protein